jgi:hypothetical protein
MRAAVSLATLVCFAPVAAGCLSNEYVIPNDELGRLAAAPPLTRGDHVHVVQKVGSRRGDPISPEAPAPRRTAPPADIYTQPADDEPAYSSDGSLDIHVDAGGGGSSPTPGGWRAQPAHANSGWRGSPSTGGGWHGTPSGGGGWHGAPSHGGGGGGLSLPSGGGGGKGEELVVIAVIAIVVVAIVAVGLVGAEGLRFDGYAQMSPAQPIHLKRDGREIVVPLGDLGPGDVVGLEEALVMDDEGYGFRRLEHPLVRKGLAFKLDAGTIGFAGGDSTVIGPTAHFQVGGFFTNDFGVLLTGEVGGATDRFGATLTRHSIGLELQAFWLDRGPFHLGNYLNGGQAFSGKTGEDVIHYGPRVGGGLLAEIDLTGRMALVLRGGGSVAQLDGWSSDASGTIGLAVY